MATPGDFAAFLDQVGEECDADLHTRIEVAKRKEEARQDFLLEFDAAVEAVILPVFEEAAGRSTKAFHLRVAPGRGKGVTELIITIQRSPKESITGRLRYRAALSPKAVTLEEQLREGGLIDHTPMPPPRELTAEEVTRHVTEFIKRFACEA
jgi:hypothetical protein